MTNNWKDEEVDALKFLFMGRIKLMRIARIIGRSESAVNNKLFRLDLFAERRKMLARKIARGIKEGLSDYQLSSRLGVCRNTARKYRKDLGRAIQ